MIIQQSMYGFLTMVPHPNWNVDIALQRLDNAIRGLILMEEKIARRATTNSCIQAGRSGE